MTDKFSNSVHGFADQKQGLLTKEDSSSQVKTSFWILTINLVMCGLGTGLLSLPWGIAGSSLLPGILIISFGLVVNGITSIGLIYAAERCKCFDLGGLMKIATGSSAAENCTNLIILISNFLCLVSYLLVIDDSLAPILQEISFLSAFGNSRILLITCASTFVLPLCFCPQQYLGFTSMLSVLCNIYMFVVAIEQFFELKDHRPHSCIIGYGTGVITMFSATMQTTLIQACVFPMYEEMDNRSPRNFGVALTYAFIFLIVLFSAFSAVCYLTFGPTTNSNIFNSFSSTPFVHLGRAGMLIVCLGVYPLMLLPMVSSLGEQYKSGTKNTAAIVCIVGAAMVTSWYYTQLGALNVINAAFSVAVLVGIAPGICGYRFLDLSVSSATVLIILASFCTIVGLIYTQNSAQGLHCMWSNTNMPMDLENESRTVVSLKSQRHHIINSIL